MFRKALRRTFHRGDSSAERSKGHHAPPESECSTDQSRATLTAWTPTSSTPVEAKTATPELAEGGSVLRVVASTPLQQDQSSTLPVLNDRSAQLEVISRGQGDSSREKAISTLKLASEEFTTNYEKYQKKHREFMNISNEINSAILMSDTGRDISFSITVFKQQIANVVECTCRKQEISKAKWPNRVGTFLISLYPVVKIAVGLATTAAEILENETDRRGRFLKTLEEIEFQAARLLSNRHFDIMVSSKLLQERALYLMTNIISFCNSALMYFARDFFVVGGQTRYDEAETALKDAIRRYNETIGDLTASCVIEERHQKFVILKEKQDEKFLQWLMPSHWQTEAQLLVLRRRYQDASLGWAHKMEEFQNWCASDNLSESRERVLWIVGAPGVGKSTLAAYLVEFTRSIDKDAILAYFFVRRDSSGLTKPSDILRTLSYQCSLMDPKVRGALDSLKTNGFRIEDNLGMHFLATKLLVEPLSETTKPIYIIMDGLEEANKALDSVDGRRQGIEILIEQLCNLVSARLLFLCRPQSVLSKVKRRSTFRTIGFNENKDDIESYVRQQLTEHKSLQNRFAREGIEPVQFFLSNSNGIFLWVVLLLEQLSKASKTVFQKYVRDVTQAPSDMTQLYINILEYLNGEQRRWVREMLYWIVAPRRQLTVKELQSAVEWCLEDELESFEEFLHLQCGSIFIVAGQADGDGIVQIVHETFRAFLEDHERCPPDLHLTVDLAHKHLASTSLQFLSSDGAADQAIYPYLAENWNYHLISVKRSREVGDILEHLHSFFHSKNFKEWLYYQLVNGWNNENLLKAETDIEDKVLRDVRDWIVWCRGCESGAPQAQADELKNAISWSDSILEKPSVLGEYIGKAAALIWLFEHLPSMKARIAAFELAIRHYWRGQSNVAHSNRDDLERLIKTRFSALREWVGGSTFNCLLAENMEVARATLKRWDENLAFKSLITTQDNHTLWEDICRRHIATSHGLVPNDTQSLPSRLLGAAHERSVSLHAAVEWLKQRAMTDPTDYSALVDLGDVYRASCRYDEALKAYHSALEIRPRDIAIYENLAEVYKATGNHQKSIQTFETAVQQLPDADTWCALGRAHRAALNEEKAMECFQRSVEINPAFAPGWKSLVDIYNIKKEFDKTVDAYEKEAIADPNCSWVWSGLGDAYRGQKRFKEAIDAYKTAVDRNPADPWAWTCLADAYRVNGQYTEAIDAYWISLEKNSRDSWPWRGLVDSYCATSEPVRAMALATKATERLSIDYSFHITLGKMLQDNGHHEMALEHFERAVDRCPLGDQLLYAFINLPTSHLFSNYPIISIDEKITSSLLWSSIAQCLHYMGHETRASEIYDTVINEYIAAITDPGPGQSRLLWVYSSLSASRGFDPFENRCSLKMEILLTMLAEAYRAKGDYSGAAKTYEKVLEILPSNKWIWTMLGNMYDLANNQEMAEQARREGAEVVGYYCETFYCF